MKKRNKFLSAKEAKHLADTSPFLKNQVYTCIEETAEENRTAITWNIHSMSHEALDNLKKDLRTNGYQIKEDNNLLYISWDNFGIIERKSKHEINI